MRQRRMSPEEISHYLKQVERRGKALSLPVDQLGRYRGEYDKITAYLRAEYRRFLCSKIVRRNRYIDLNVFRRLVTEEENRLLALANQALDRGNGKDFDWCCWMLHLRYMALWKDTKEEQYA